MPLLVQTVSTLVILKFHPIFGSIKSHKTTGNLITTMKYLVRLTSLVYQIYSIMKVTMKYLNNSKLTFRLCKLQASSRMTYQVSYTQMLYQI